MKTLSLKPLILGNELQGFVIKSYNHNYRSIHVYIYEQCCVNVNETVTEDKNNLNAEATSH